MHCAFWAYGCLAICAADFPPLGGTLSLWQHSTRASFILQLYTNSGGTVFAIEIIGTCCEGEVVGFGCAGWGCTLCEDLGAEADEETFASFTGASTRLATYCSTHAGLYRLDAEE